MFNKIEINYPDFWLKLEREFWPWINLIEEPNGYGKSTILNTLLSLYSKKYPWLRTLPSWSAKIHTPDKVYMLSKALWIWLDQEPNALIKYILPWEFFNLSTPEQRLTLVKLLGVDFEWYMKDNVPWWTPTLEKELNARLKENKGKEDIILDDIIRFKSIVTKFEKNPVSIEDNSSEIESKYREYESKYNGNRIAIQLANNEAVATNNRNQINITNLKTKIEDLREEFKNVKKNCPACWAELSSDKYTKVVEWINAKGKELKRQLADLESIPLLPTNIVPEPLNPMTIDQKAWFLQMILRQSNQVDKDMVNEYQSAKRELGIKEAQLKALGELNDKEILTFIKKYKIQFTKDLEDKVKGLWLDIELFKTQANWDVVESFQIMLNRQPYTELSWGNRLLCQIRLSLAFVKQLWLDFILIDEAWLISQKNYDIIDNECDWLQVIMARATPFVATKSSDVTKEIKVKTKTKK